MQKRVDFIEVCIYGLNTYNEKAIKGGDNLNTFI